MIKRFALALATSIVLALSIAGAQVAPGGAGGIGYFKGAAATVAAALHDTMCLDLANNDTCLARDGAGILSQRNTTNAQRFNVANTYAAAGANTTEWFSADWKTTANVLRVGLRTTASISAHPMYLEAQANGAGDTYSRIVMKANSTPIFSQGLWTAAQVLINSSLTGNFAELANITSTALSGNVVAVAIVPTYNQSGSTAAATDLLINRTQTAVGSGAQLLLDAQVSTASKFSVSNTGLTNAVGGYQVNGVLFVSPTAPTVTSAGTTPSVPNANGSVSFRVNVGTGGTATTVVTAMPTAPAGWNCDAQNITANAANRAGQQVVQQASTTTSATVQNQTISTGAALAFTASDIVRYICFAF